MRSVASIDELVAAMRAAYEQCRQLVAVLDQATDHANSYVAMIAGTPPPAAGPPSADRPAREAEPWRLTRAQVERLREQLPPPITADGRGTGRKTHGRWVDADGVPREITSGQDDSARDATARLRLLGYRRLWIADHAEIKLAARMRAQRDATGQRQHATLVINQVPCGGAFGCAEVLPVLLPAGCSLTVHAPNYRRTFTGGRSS
jgi:hypothetical protein